MSRLSPEVSFVIPPGAEDLRATMAMTLGLLAALAADHKIKLQSHTLLRLQCERGCWEKRCHDSLVQRFHVSELCSWTVL